MAAYDKGIGGELAIVSDYWMSVLSGRGDLKIPKTCQNVLKIGNLTNTRAVAVMLIQKERNTT